MLPTTKLARFVNMKILKVIRKYAKIVELFSCSRSHLQMKNTHVREYIPRLGIYKF